MDDFRPWSSTQLFDSDNVWENQAAASLLESSSRTKCQNGSRAWRLSPLAPRTDYV